MAMQSQPHACMRACMQTSATEINMVVMTLRVQGAAPGHPDKQAGDDNSPQ